jgi:Mg2+ and Co2+ transporter CorA
MLNPTQQELSLLDEVFAFHPLAIGGSIKYSQRPKIESYHRPGDGVAVMLYWFRRKRWI